MNKKKNIPTKPEPPPMRAVSGLFGIWMNEWETVDWYTRKGELYDRVITPKKDIFDRLFECGYKNKLEDSLKRNRQLAN